MGKEVHTTTSAFTRDAVDYDTRIEQWIDVGGGPRLTSLMIDHDLDINDVVRCPRRGGAARSICARAALY